MSDRFPNGFDTERQKVNASSDRALYPYLQVHILGPYSNDCHAFLTEIKRRLHDSGFTGAKLCTDRNEPLPDHLQDIEPESRSSEEEQEVREFWTEVSYRFLDNADVAIFFFLDPRLNRSYLPDRAFRDGKAPTTSLPESYDTPQDANISVLEELNYWSREMGMDPSRTLALFEQGNYDGMGSLASGRVGLEGCHWGRFVDNDIETALQNARSRCMNWAMNECKPRLQDRYYAGQS